MALRFDGLVRAHGFMKTERPPEIWEADTDDLGYVPLLGEMIAAGLSGGAPLDELTLNVSNVVVLPDDEPDQDRAIPVGEFVAVTVRGQSDFGPDHAWVPGCTLPPALLLARLDDRLSHAGARYAYVRHLPHQGSITVFVARLSTP